MNVFVLGAPGSGKSAVVSPLRRRMPAQIILDWDFLMDSVGSLTGRSIRSDRTSWPQYDSLLRDVLAQCAGHPVVMLGPKSPAELPDWPIATWVLLDCSDSVRTARLAERGHDVEAAIRDARAYRQLGLITMDSSEMSVDATADHLAQVIEALDLEAERDAAGGTKG